MDILASGPDEKSFARFAEQGYNRIPVWMEADADLISPLTLYHRLTIAGNAENTLLLESAMTESDLGRYSIICPQAKYRLEVRGEQVRVLKDGKLSEHGQEQDAIAWVQRFFRRFRVANEALPAHAHSWGGLYGYFGYDTVRSIEPVLKQGRDGKAPAMTDIPDICLLLCDHLAVLDHRNGRIFLIVYADPKEVSWKEAHRQLEEMAAKLDNAEEPAAFIPCEDAERKDIRMPYSFERAAFTQAVERIRAYTRSGDCMQVVLSGVFTAPLDADPLLLYRSLRTVSPSPYLYFLNLGDFHIVGASPEEVVSLNRGRVLIRPIAGTRRRGRNAEEDLALEREMLEDPKEIAEHVMLVDLARNDVGRVCEIGTVSVDEYLTVHRYQQVMHIVSTVTGQLRPALDACDLLRATFPAGTLSGAPKVRAMEIIDELEPVGRGLYGGGVGGIRYDGDMTLAIAIRTAVVQDGRAYIAAGGGIVADSVPDLEWKEVHNKAHPLARAMARLQGAK